MGNHDGPSGAAGASYGRYFLLALFLLSLGLFIWVIHVFLIPILLASVFVTLFYPLYRRLLAGLHGRRGASALVCCLILLVGLLLPLFFVANLAVVQALEISQDLLPRIQAAIEQGDRGIMGRIKEWPVVRWLRANRIDWRTTLLEGLRASGGAVARLVNKLSRSTLSFFVDLFVLFFFMYFFFRDAERFLSKVKRLVPLDDRAVDEIVRRFGSVSRSTVRVTLVIGLIQGTVSALTMLSFGLPGWLLWGVVILFLSVIPVLGSWTVLVPAGIIEIAAGRVWQGITIILISTVVLTLIDNILRPRLVGRDVGVHVLLIFVSTLGGLIVFGFSGFIVGPVIAAVFTTVAGIYSGEFARKPRAI